MKKLIVFLLASLLLLAACGNSKLDEATENLYIDQTKRAVTLFNEEKFDEMRTMFDETMKEALSTEELQTTVDIVKESGVFEQFEKSSVVLREGYYVTTLTAKYSEAERIYTITFDDQQRLAGFYVK